MGLELLFRSHLQSHHPRTAGRLVQVYRERDIKMSDVNRVHTYVLVLSPNSISSLTMMYTTICQFRWDLSCAAVPASS